VPPLTQYVPERAAASAVDVPASIVTALGTAKLEPVPFFLALVGNEPRV